MGWTSPTSGVHHGAPRAESAAAAAPRARAYTVGRHLVFGTGRYDPGSATGRELLAHELMHAAGQSPAGPLETAAQGAETGVRAAAATLAGGGRVPPPSAGRRRIERDFDSTISIRHHLLDSRTFPVTDGHVRLVIRAGYVAAEDATAEAAGLARRPALRDGHPRPQQRARRGGRGRAGAGRPGGRAPWMVSRPATTTSRSSGSTDHPLRV